MEYNFNLKKWYFFEWNWHLKTLIGIVRFYNSTNISVGISQTTDQYLYTAWIKCSFYINKYFPLLKIPLVYRKTNTISLYEMLSN